MAPAPDDLSRPDFARMVEEDADGLFLFDAELRYLYVNREAERLARTPRAGLLGRTLAEAFPQVAAGETGRTFLRCVRERTAATLRVPSSVHADARLEVRCVPCSLPPDGSPGLMVYARDVTGAARAEERERFLADLTERTRALLDPDEVIRETVRSVGAFLGLSRYMYADVDPDTGTLTVHEDWCRGEGVSSVAGTWPLAPWGAGVLDDLSAGRTVVNRDHATDPRTAGDHEAIYRQTDIRANITVPCHRDGRWAGVFSAQMCGAPRDWSPDEVGLLERAARRMWMTLENARLLRDAERERERFGALVRASSQMVWRTDREGLIRDMPEWRAYTGQSEDEVRGYGWVAAIHPDDRARVEAVWREAYGRRAVYECEYRVRGADGAYRWFFARGVPLSEADGATLREYIGTWADIDARKRLEERQVRIADALQEGALRAPAADAFPGLEVGRLYEAAWDEALVGGDFFDAFALEDGRVALVVGDVTGKGLDAASSTAGVKFALRAYLREGRPSPGAALGRLSRFLEAGHRLDGRQRPDERPSFVCVTLAVLDPATGAGAAAAAGGEPPLVVCAGGGRCLEVPVSGTMLGADAGSGYDEAPFTLGPGDLLLLTTDGVTEARRPGGRRRDFFGAEGLARAASAAAREGADPEGCVRAVAGAAREFAGGRAQDDVCLLAARLRPAPEGRG